MGSFGLDLNSSLNRWKFQTLKSKLVPQELIPWKEKWGPSASTWKVRHYLLCLWELISTSISLRVKRKRWRAPSGFGYGGLDMWQKQIVMDPGECNECVGGCVHLPTQAPVLVRLAPVYRTFSGVLCDNWCFRSCPSAAVNSVGHRESRVTSELPTPRWFVWGVICVMKLPGAQEAVSLLKQGKRISNTLLFPGCNNLPYKSAQALLLIFSLCRKQLLLLMLH